VLTFSPQIGVSVVGLLIAWFLARRLSSIRHRQLLMLGISYVFYATWGRLWFLGVLIFSSLMNYALGNFLRRKPSARRLWLGILLNVILLSVFKYLPLLGSGVQNSPLAFLGRIVLPVGISFWTFQALSYLFDLYREEELNPSLLEFLLYMSFWPTVLSGPICRLPRMLPQLRQEWNTSLEELGIGTQRIGIGLLMMSLSQLLAAGLRPGKGLDSAFALPAERLAGLDVWIMIFAYGFQLFFSFCGYSHLVIGAARLFGIELQENFRRPYLSLSISEFWTRWHMSLSFWIRDYMFFPLATMRRGVWWRNVCLVIAMFVFGLWHQGTLLFMVWGIYHGLLLVLHRQWQQLRLRTQVHLPGYLATPFSWAATFTGVSVGWIFFRAENVHQAATMLRIAFIPGLLHRRALPVTFYTVSLLLAAGYFLVVWAAELLNHCSSESDGFPLAGPRGFLARHRWVWITPLSAVLSLYFFLFFRPQIGAAKPMLYGLF
jgi:alginate O-acetyltransferase complex protein AlgI